jgi:two-component system cell cycle sensor histidine kinase/response regulator CckA
VEDEDAVRRVGQRILRRLGLDVTSAQDGREALQALRTMEPEPDLVVTDVLMPRVSGPEFVRRMRKEGITVPVLFVSGYSATELEDYDLHHGAAFLAKPFTPEELGIKVAELLGPEADGDAGDAGDAG